jgi:hypothetical protein
MKTDFTGQDRQQPAQLRFTVVHKSRPRRPEPLDLRTPSGRVLPY